MKQYRRPIIAGIILLVTAAVCTKYLMDHPEVIEQLGEVPLSTLALLLPLYGVWFLALVLVTRFSLRAYGKTMGRQENLLFNAYSSLINFFGPGQSGPIFRGVYLKKRHGFGVKQYMFTTLLYYAFYAVLSACLLFISSRPWWQTALLIAGVGASSFTLIRWYRLKKMQDETALNLPAFGLILAATALQIAAQAAIYAVELHSSGADASLGQVLSYTGAANFALFVALTPGAIGIREAFLVFTQQLHGLNSAVIVAANLIDRAVYLLFLGLLLLIVVTTHAKDKLRISQLGINKAKS